MAANMTDDLLNDDMDRTETVVWKYKWSSSQIYEEVSQVLNPPSKVKKPENNSESEPLGAC